jgi:hypothetical protein
MRVNCLPSLLTRITTISVGMCMIGRLHIPIKQAILCYLKLAEVFTNTKPLGTSAFRMTKLKEVLKQVVHDALGDENTRMLDTRPDADKCRT